MAQRRSRIRFLAVALVACMGLAAEPSALAGGAPVVTSGSRSRPWIALTFDDGWGVANCRRVVAILQETDTPATFLPTAGNVRGAPAFWRRVAQLGYPIGNHTVHRRVLRGVPQWRQVREIADARTIIEGITGVPMAPVLRPPTGAYDATTRRVALRLGFSAILLWDTTFADTSHRPGGGDWPLSAYLRAATRGGRGSIVLAHCGSDVTVRILRQVIATYRARGLRFVTVPQLLGPAGDAPGD
ncbi:MAG: polysaccharide deacetylase family protein [Chloroflexota bacterium]